MWFTQSSGEELAQDSLKEAATAEKGSRVLLKDHDDLS